MYELPTALKSRLMAPGILRAEELARLIEATVDAYQREMAGIHSILLFGGITLGEFHPDFSDVDLAVVLEDGTRDLVARLPESVRAAIQEIPAYSRTHVQAKHVRGSVLNAMEDEDWQAWAEWSASNLVTESTYPFTLCDTWLIHRRSMTLSGLDDQDRFPFADCPPTHREVELSRLRSYARRLALPRPFGGLSGLELVGEFIYYGTAHK